MHNCELGFRMHNRGFTLIEIIIALAIFAILATITSSLLVQSINVQERVTKSSERTAQFELAISLFQQDINQFIPRPVRGNEMHLFPPLIGQAKYMEFTRGGVANPMGLEQRSTLVRVAYVCDRHQLLRRTWPELDTANRDHYQDTVLLKQLKSCSFEYMGMHNILVSSWYQEPLQDKKRSRIFLPKAIKINLVLNETEPLALLFIIPGVLYG